MRILCVKLHQVTQLLSPKLEIQLQAESVQGLWVCFFYNLLR